MPVTRIHLGLPVTDLDRSVRFYRRLLEADPVRERPGYAKFAPNFVPINLALNQVAESTAPAGARRHFGLELKDSDEVRAWTKRLQSLDLETTVEQEVTCCWGVQDKVWVTDPDGHPWEVYTVLADAAVERDETTKCCTEGCCAEDCCT